MPQPPDPARPGPDGAPGTGGDTGSFHRPSSVAYDRTWELELLISGAVVFALLQLPPAVERWHRRVDPHLVGSAEQLASYVYFYSKLILYTLIGTFIVHLAARAYWVGLLGLDTVFPHGVRWEKLKQGPITRRLYQDRQPSIEALITRVDRFCSVIFSFAFMIVFIFLLSLILFGVLWLVALAISTLFLDGRHLKPLVNLLLALVLGPPIILPLIDRSLAGRLDPQGRTGTLIYRLSGLWYGLMASVTYVPVFNVLVTNARKQTSMNTLFFAAFAGLMMLFLVKDVFIPAGLLTASGYQYLPDVRGTDSFEPRYYADQLSDEETAGVHPAIQSQVIRDPFVRLFIPYLPRTHDAAVEKKCGKLPVLGGTGLRWVGRDPAPAEPDAVRAVLSCLATLQPIALNGRSLTPEYRFFTEPRSGRRGIIAFLPTAGLPEGENLLRIEAITRPDRRTRPPFEIPFWIERPPAAPASR